MAFFKRQGHWAWPRISCMGWIDAFSVGVLDLDWAVCLKARGGQNGKGLKTCA
jgi:hypothetical protein